jgi:tRNA1(Val) A37 N6-methylase TrmN6
MLELDLWQTELLLATAGTLAVVLVVVMLLRPRIFTSYLKHMTGIELSPKEVAQVYKKRGKAGVRELFLDLIIREDARSGPVITPDSPPDREVLLPPEKI